MSYKIEKGIPMPTKNAWKDHPYPWDSIEVGDSFLMEEKEDGEILRARVWASFCAFRRQNSKFKMKIRTMKLPEGLRVWRTQ